MATLASVLDLMPLLGKQIQINGWPGSDKQCQSSLINVGGYGNLPLCVARFGQSTAGLCNRETFLWSRRRPARVKPRW